MCACSLKLCRCQGLRRAILRCMAGSTACRCSGMTAFTKQTHKTSTTCRLSLEGSPALPHCLQAWPLSRPKSTACSLSGVTALNQYQLALQAHNSSRHSENLLQMVVQLWWLS